LPIESNIDWILTLTDYGNHKYISMVAKGNVVGAQFHPEKSGPVGLAMIRSFLAAHGSMNTKEAGSFKGLSSFANLPRTILSKRIIACLDVRANDDGDLVVTKGDQYDVREVAADTTTGRYR
jgi:glutamine amidotransferase/cyclase